MQKGKVVSKAAVELLKLFEKSGAFVLRNELHDRSSLVCIFGETFGCAHDDDVDSRCNASNTWASPGSAETAIKLPVHQISLAALQQKKVALTPTQCHIVAKASAAILQTKEKQHGATRDIKHATDFISTGYQQQAPAAQKIAQQLITAIQGSSKHICCISTQYKADTEVGNRRKVSTPSSVNLQQQQRNTSISQNQGTAQLSIPQHPRKDLL
ncbi:hypothetical protein Nepgr_023917 [Nepenthes gracilis]|uniref:Uncharacterized protein n=1 Tax=Nepenthes gracilis TaxID=150966 RepID=A0AAD3T3M8_NEPGR|nr:hypothetical protein Nepgr_023917 [Nepenthes gracilis]